MGKVTDAESFTANVIKMSNYQADPLAATLHTRTLGLAKVHVTPDQIKQDKDLFSKSIMVRGDMRNGLKIDATDGRSKASSRAGSIAGSKVGSKIGSPKTLKQISDIEAALYRKQISENYHTSVPKFLRSHGPFAVYDHSAHKGDKAYFTVGTVNEQALNRYTEDIKNVQKMRETEKT